MLIDALFLPGFHQVMGKKMGTPKLPHFLNLDESMFFLVTHGLLKIDNSM
jgi:hypothetical protein